MFREWNGSDSRSFERDVTFGSIQTVEETTYIDGPAYEGDKPVRRTILEGVATGDSNFGPFLLSKVFQPLNKFESIEVVVDNHIGREPTPGGAPNCPTDGSGCDAIGWFAAHILIDDGGNFNGERRILAELENRASGVQRIVRIRVNYREGVLKS